MSDKPIWERQDYDTNKSFNAFCIYRDMGSTRSLEKAWLQYQDRTETVSGYFRQWSIDYNWQERVNNYDDYVRDQHRQRMEDAQLEVIDNALSDYRAIRKAIEKRLKTLEDVNYVSPLADLQELLALMKNADYYARLAVGLPDKITSSKNELTGKDGAAIETRNTNVNIEAQDAHDAGNILRQLADLGAIPSATSTEDNNTETE